MNYFYKTINFLKNAIDYVKGGRGAGTKLSFVDHSQAHKYDSIKICGGWYILVPKAQ